MKYFLGFTLAMAVAGVGCGEGHVSTALDGSTTSDSGNVERDMGSFMFRDSSTATCAESGENCLGLPCCGSLMCVVPANGGTPTCNGVLGDGGTTPDAATPVDAAVDATIDAAVEMDAAIDAAIDAAAPDAEAPTESNIRLVVLLGEGDPISLDCDDDTTYEGVVTPPGTSSGGLITSGERTCDINVNDVFLLEENLSFSVPTTPGAFTLAHTGRSNYTWIAEELTAEEGHFYAHFVNFYGNAEQVTFYDSSLDPREGELIGNTEFSGYTTGGFQLVTTERAVDWHFGADVTNDGTPDVWFKLPKETEFSTETNPVVNFFFFDDGATLRDSRMYVQLPDGEFLTLDPIFEETATLRLTMLAATSATTTFGGMSVRLECPGPTGDVELVTVAARTNYVPTDFAEVYLWPAICKGYDPTTSVLLGEIPFSLPGGYEDNTTWAIVPGTSDDFDFQSQFTETPVADGDTNLRFVNFMASTMLPTTVTDIAVEGVITELDEPFGPSNERTFSVTTGSPGDEMIVDWEDDYRGVYNISGLLSSSGEYLIYFVYDLDETYHVIIQPPAGSGETFSDVAPTFFGLPG